MDRTQQIKNIHPHKLNTWQYIRKLMKRKLLK